MLFIQCLCSNRRKRVVKNLSLVIYIIKDEFGKLSHLNISSSHFLVVGIDRFLFYNKNIGLKLKHLPQYFLIQD